MQNEAARQPLPIKSQCHTQDSNTYIEEEISNNEFQKTKNSKNDLTTSKKKHKS
jgi:hypothetical protein